VYLFLLLAQIKPPDFDILAFEESQEEEEGGYVQLKNRPHIVSYSNQLLSCYYYSNALRYEVEYGPGNIMEKSKVPYTLIHTSS